MRANHNPDNNETDKNREATGAQPTDETRSKANEKAGNGHAKTDEPWKKSWFPDLNIDHVAILLGSKANKEGFIWLPNPVNDGGGYRGCGLRADLDAPYGFSVYIENCSGENERREVEKFIINALNLGKRDEAGVRPQTKKEREEHRMRLAERVSAWQRDHRYKLGEAMHDWWDDDHEYNPARILTKKNAGPPGVYLESRGVELYDYGVARYKPEWDFEASSNTPKEKHNIIQGAMACLTHDPETGVVVGVHLTYINAQGKAVEYHGARKRTLVSNIGIVKLRPIEGSRVLVVAEGPETALSAMRIPELDGMTLWSTSTALGLINLMPLIDFDEIIIILDIDKPRNGETLGAGEKAAQTCAYNWLRANKRVRFLRPMLPPGEEKIDLNDTVRNPNFVAADYVIYDYNLPPDQTPFIRDDKERIIVNDTNIKILLMRTRTIGSLLFYNEFYQDVMITAPLPGQTPIGRYPRPFSDEDWRALVSCVQHTRYFEKASREMIFAGLLMFAESKPVHPLRDYLENLKWDGVSRVDTLFSDYLGVVDSRYSRLVSSIFLKSAVRRVMEPGCKAEQSPVLVGPQALFKSTVLQILAGDEYFSDGLPSLNGQLKEALEHLQQFWFVEVAEGSSFRNADADRLKNFLSMRQDPYRTPYGRRTAKHPRHTVLPISTNNPTPLKDDTGARRFMAMNTGEAFAPTKEHMARLRENRDQIWAEAFHRVMTLGEIWHTEGDDNKLFAEVQERFREIDACEDAFVTVMERVKGHRSVVIWPNDLQDFFFDLKRCGGKMIGPSKYGDMLKKLGWSSQPRKIVIQNPRKVKGKPVMKPRLVSSEKMRLWALADNPGGHAYRHVYRYHSSGNGKMGRWEIEKTWDHDPLDDPPNFARQAS